MFIYQSQGNKLVPIKEIRREYLERDVQRLVEHNLSHILGLEFLASEYKVGNFRIDTLAYDPETSAFIVIEYKRDRSFSVSDQGMAYLTLLSNNKAEFVLFYNQLKNVNKAISDFDWKQIRVILMAHSFTPYQLQALSFKDLPVDLWGVSLYESDIVSLRKVEVPAATTAMAEISRSTEYKKVSKELEPTSPEEIMRKIKDEVAKSRATEIMEYCMSFEGVTQYCTKNHIVYKTKQAFAKVYPQGKQFWVDVRWVSDPEKLLLHNHPIFGHIRVDNDLDLSKVKDLIKKSYEQVSA